MTFNLHFLTAVFVVLKALGYLTWSWWLVLAPTLFSIGLAVALVVLAVVIALLNEFVN